jgi:hypothetical protein
MFETRYSLDQLAVVRKGESLQKSGNNNLYETRHIKVIIHLYARNNRNQFPGRFFDRKRRIVR